MPDIRLTPEEEKGDLPDVCMCCGAPATERIPRTFIVQPPVVHGPSGFREIYAFRLLIATAQAPRMRLRTTFCSRHRNYWKLRFALKWGGLAIFFVWLFLGCAGIVFTLGVLKRDMPVLDFFLVAPAFVYLIALLIGIFFVESRSVRAQFATDGTEDVVLHNVHPRYVEALQEHRTQSRPARRGAAEESLPEALPGEGGITTDPVRRRPLPEARRESKKQLGDGPQEAAAYQSIADQLTRGISPKEVEADLARSGWPADAAQLLGARVLEEMPGFLRGRYGWQLYVSLGLLGVALLLLLGLSIGLLAARETSTAQWQFWVLALLWVLGQGYWSAVCIRKVLLAQRLEKERAAWLRASGIVVGVAAPAPSATPRPSDGDSSSSLARRAIEARDVQRLQRSGMLFGCSVALLFVLGLCVIVPLADRILSSRSSGRGGGGNGSGGSGDGFSKLPATAPLPAELRGRPSVDLLALLDLKKDVVHGPWEVRKGTLYCTHGGFVPRIQFPYLPPEEYDFVVTFGAPERQTGVCLVMPRPRGGSFFWVAGGGDHGAEYGFWGKPLQQSKDPIKPGTVHTTKVEVRKNSVGGFIDGKEMMHLVTDFHDLTADDWRKINDVRFPAVACDSPIAYYQVRIMDVTGQGRKAR